VPTLRWRLPLALGGARGRYEIPFGALERPHCQGEEVPALRWAQVHGQIGGQAAGCLLANDCKYGHSLEGSVLRVTLIRSAYDPDPWPEVGRHAARWTLRPYVGELAAAQAIADGQRLNHPLRVVGTDVHAGRLPPVGQALRLTSGSVVVDAVKQAEAGDALIVRLHNPAPAAAVAHLEVAAALWGALRQAQLTDLLERPLADPTLRQHGNQVELTVPAHGLCTLRLELQR